MRLRWAEVTLDCRDPVEVSRFWQSLLGGELTEPLPGWRRLALTDRPDLTFQPVPEPKTAKSRMHLDLEVDDLETVIARVETLGAGGPVSGRTTRRAESRCCSTSRGRSSASCSSPTPAAPTGRTERTRTAVRFCCQGRIEAWTRSGSDPCG